MGNACFPRQDGKLVSTKSRENVGIAECFLKGIGRADQRQVSLAVSEGIVDRLEIVDIEIEEQNALFSRRASFSCCVTEARKPRRLKKPVRSSVMASERTSRSSNDFCTAHRAARLSVASTATGSTAPNLNVFERSLKARRILSSSRTSDVKAEVTSDSIVSLRGCFLRSMERTWLFGFRCLTVGVGKGVPLGLYDPCARLDFLRTAPLERLREVKTQLRLSRQKRRRPSLAVCTITIGAGRVRGCSVLHIGLRL